MIRKSTLIVALAAVVLLVGTSCDTLVTLTKPTVTAEALSTNNGGTLRLTWTAVTDAKSYEITTDDSTFTTTSTSYDVATPSATIEVRAVNGSDKSDPATIDCKVVETSSLVLYGISDVNPDHSSGLAFTTSGSASAMSLADANKASLDFVCDDQETTVLPVGLVNAGSYGWTQNNKMNTLMDAVTTDFDAFKLAAVTGYGDLQTVAVNGVYAFWLSSSMAWTSSDHFCKAKIISIEDVSGTQKVTLKLAYQKIGGLRWLVN